MLIFFVVFVMWSNFIWWLRIFENFTFYFDLITSTIDDMKYFFAIFILIICACGNLIYVLNANRYSYRENDEYALFEDSFSEGLGFLSAILNQFIVSLGQGDFENYSKDEAVDRNLVWI